MLASSQKPVQLVLETDALQLVYKMAIALKADNIVVHQSYVESLKILN